jgi:hypothetical protein
VASFVSTKHRAQDRREAKAPFAQLSQSQLVGPIRVIAIERHGPGTFKIRAVGMNAVADSAPPISSKCGENLGTGFRPRVIAVM